MARGRKHSFPENKRRADLGVEFSGQTKKGSGGQESELTPPGELF